MFANGAVSLHVTDFRGGSDTAVGIFVDTIADSGLSLKELGEEFGGFFLVSNRGDS